MQSSDSNKVRNN